MLYIELVREDGSLYLYTTDGDLIYSKTANGFESFIEYDEYHRKTHFKGSDGFEYWYDEYGRVIHFKKYNGFESWTEYDNFGKEVYYKNSRGFESWREYDADGKLIHLINTNGIDRWYM